MRSTVLSGAVDGGGREGGVLRRIRRKCTGGDLGREELLGPKISVRERKTSRHEPPFKADVATVRRKNAGLSERGQPRSVIKNVYNYKF